MPLKETTTMEQKVELICEWLTQQYTITELCRAFEISRPTAHKKICRYEQEGIKGLLDQSRSPINHRNRTDHKVVKVRVFSGAQKNSRLI